MGLKGSCLCGEISYEIDSVDMPIVHCHCQTCRKAHAASFAATAGVKRENFRWLSGINSISTFESSPGKSRHFCKRCGSHLVAESQTNFGQDLDDPLTHFCHGKRAGRLRRALEHRGHVHPRRAFGRADRPADQPLSQPQPHQAGSLCLLLHCGRDLDPTGTFIKELLSWGPF